MAEPEASGATRLTASDPMRAVRLLTAAVMGIAALAASGLVRMTPLGGERETWLAAILITLGWAVSEVFVVHVHLRRDSHSYSLSEAPLVIGLFLVTPRVHLAGAVIGVGLALVLHRRQQPIKVAFNCAKVALEVASATVTFRLVVEARSMPTNSDIVGAFVAALVACVVGAVLVSCVIAVVDGSWKEAGFLGSLPMTAFGTLTAAALGCVTVVVIDASPALSWLLLVPATGCFLLYRAWTNQSRRVESLGFLYRTAQVLQEHATINDAIIALLKETRELLKSEQVEIFYRPAGADLGVHARFSADDSSSVGVCELGEVEVLVGLVGEDDEARLVEVRTHPQLAALGAPEQLAIVAPLHVADVTIGTFLVSPPSSAVARFGEDERMLVDTTARALSVALENGSLEYSLQQLRDLEEQLVHQAYHDPLTKLPNRAMFIEHVEAVDADKDPDHVYGVLFVDLDDFKTVNDSLGHAAGDALLVEVGTRIRRCLRDGDLAARLGGDEFAVILDPVADAEEADSVARRILATFEEPLQLVGRDVKVAASIGIAMSTDGTSVTELLKGADVAMYIAKAAGKGQTALFKPAMQSEMMARYQLLLDVQVARPRGEFTVVFQPVVTLETGTVCSAEALIRWNHPERGPIAPDVFITLAEENGAIRDITDLVLHEACAVLAEQPVEVLPRVSFNASSRDLSSGAFVLSVQSAIGHYGIDPSRLVCEVTESLLLEAEAIDTLHAIRSLGVRTALDDFGTGYSSLQTLRQLPLDQIKIAKPFVDELGTSAEARTFIEAIVTLGRTLGLEVLAEGVEEQVQADELLGVGCHMAQGFLFARPMSHAALTARLGGTPVDASRAAARSNPSEGTAGLIEPSAEERRDRLRRERRTDRPPDGGDDGLPDRPILTDIA